MSIDHTPENAARDLSQYGRALRRADYERCGAIEKRWDLYGYSPEVVSVVLGCVATGLPLDAAIREVTQGV